LHRREDLEDAAALRTAAREKESGTMWRANEGR
jgi:hypothetical protein